MSKKEYDDFSDFNMSDSEMLGVTLKLWLAGIIKCENKDLILKCLGLYEINKKNSLDPSIGMGIDIDGNMIGTFASEDYKVIVKPPEFFTSDGSLPYEGLMIIHEKARRLYVMQECIHFLRTQALLCGIELVEEIAYEPTYFFWRK